MIEEIKDISLLKDLFDKYKDNYDPIINDYTKVYAYKIDNKYVSFIVAQILYENAEIIDVFTLEEYRRRGIAKELMHKIIDDEQVKNITLEVNINNKNAILMYNSIGFKETTLRKGYYNGEDALLMLKVKE
jgi:ribosomal-protein-alanine N-acetyltransferase